MKISWLLCTVLSVLFLFPLGKKILPLTNSLTQPYKLNFKVIVVFVLSKTSEALYGYATFLQVDCIFPIGICTHFLQMTFKKHYTAEEVNLSKPGFTMVVPVPNVWLGIHKISLNRFPLRIFFKRISSTGTLFDDFKRIYKI